ncbi:hypothetical protein [Holospora curviuscula]|uniref:Uncharacterized protein n=1 Tax=Holospora curviuscula TaxID=1082868 RepID=A0A2S5R8W6_9PROT|nr:hypothetical protein [Holospora curviuscula]PPE03764.1 hypothetical protein HCUR_00779 [Holospora curviuscula]
MKILQLTYLVISAVLVLNANSWAGPKTQHQQEQEQQLTSEQRRVLKEAQNAFEDAVRIDFLLEHDYCSEDLIFNKVHGVRINEPLRLLAHTMMLAQALCRYNTLITPRKQAEIAQNIINAAFEKRKNISASDPRDYFSSFRLLTQKREEAKRAARALIGGFGNILEEIDTNPSINYLENLYRENVLSVDKGFCELYCKDPQTKYPIMNLIAYALNKDRAPKKQLPKKNTFPKVKQDPNVPKRGRLGSLVISARTRQALNALTNLHNFAADNKFEKDPLTNKDFSNKQIAEQHKSLILTLIGDTWGELREGSFTFFNSLQPTINTKLLDLWLDSDNIVYEAYSTLRKIFCRIKVPPFDPNVWKAVPSECPDCKAYAPITTPNNDLFDQRQIIESKSSKKIKKHLKNLTQEF